MREIRTIAVILAAIVAAATTVHAKVPVDAVWNDQDAGVVVDGSADEWQGTLTYIEKAGLFFGARNDADALYLCLYSTDRQVGMHAVMHGLTVEIGERLKIQFPMGLLADGPPERGQSREQMRERALESLDTLSVSDPTASYPRRIPVGNQIGLEARLGTETDFVYELRIPLVQSELFPFAAGADTGSKINVRVDAPKIERPERGRPEGGSPPGGRGGGMRGGGGPGSMGGSGRPGGGRPGGGSPGDSGDGRPEPIRFKARLVLASPPTESP